MMWFLWTELSLRYDKLSMKIDEIIVALAGTPLQLGLRRLRVRMCGGCGGCGAVTALARVTF